MIKICLDFEVLKLAYIMIKVRRAPGAHRAVSYITANGELVGVERSPHIWLPEAY